MVSSDAAIPPDFAASVVAVPTKRHSCAPFCGWRTSASWRPVCGAGKVGLFIIGRVYPRFEARAPIARYFSRSNPGLVI
jgi:hypothetical protein